MSENNRFTFELVSELLVQYEDMKRKALQLEFELRHFESILSDEDMIDSMTFGTQVNDRVKGGQADDKIANIAISYSSKINNINLKQQDEIALELMSINIQMERIKYYISLLDKKASMVLMKLYIENLTLNEVAESLNLSVSAVKKNRIAGINRLVDMFNLIAK